MATRLQLKQRLQAYLATYSGIGTDVTSGISPATFPAYEVEFFGTTRRRSGRRNVPTYSVRVYIYGCEARDVSDDVKWRADRATAEAFIDPIAEFIADNFDLHLSLTQNAVQAGLTSTMTPVNDPGVGVLSLNRKAYAGFALEFTIT